MVTRPMAVLLQETHLQARDLSRARALIHKLYPEYAVYAGRHPKSDNKIQVVTLVHRFMAARASLLDVRTQWGTVAQEAPGALFQAHFLTVADPHGKVSVLIGNVYQYQSIQPVQQAAMLELVRLVNMRWGDQVDLVLIGGDFNASVAQRFGYAGAATTRNADAKLTAWSNLVGLTPSVPESPTWRSLDDSRQAVLDCFFWRSLMARDCITASEAFASPDPRMDHDGVRARMLCQGIGPMPPIEELRSPVRLKMDLWSTKRKAWQLAVSEALSAQTLEGDAFQRLDQAKKVAMGCARSILGERGGQLKRFVPHISEEGRKFKGRLSLLRVVKREIYSRKGQGAMPPSKAMRQAWDAGLYPQPASFQLMSDLWSTTNQVWTESWLRRLRCLTAEAREGWHELRGKELKEAAERERGDAIHRFYTGGELKRLLHPRTPTIHSPHLFTSIPNQIVASGVRLEALEAGLRRLKRVHHCICSEQMHISNIQPGDLGEVLTLIEREGMHAQLQTGNKRLVSSPEDRLCAWESELASEGTAKSAVCQICQERDLVPVTIISQGTTRSMATWCKKCCRFTTPVIHMRAYASLPFSVEGIPRVPINAGESLRGAITASDFEFFMGQLPNSKAAGPDGIPYELLKQAPGCLRELVLNCVNCVLEGGTGPPSSWLGGLVRFLLKKEDSLETAGYRPVCLLDTCYKCLSAIITDRLYRLAERYCLLDPSQEGFRRLHCTQRQVQSLHWTIQEAADCKATLHCCYLDFMNAFNSVDIEALWRWLAELNVPDIDLLKSLYSGAYYTADLPYGRSASITLSRGQKQGDKSSPLLFDLVFNALLLALKATRIGHCTMSGLHTPSKGFADDLVITTESAAGMTRLLQVVADFCAWSGMRIKREKSVITAFDYKNGRPLSTETILYEGAPLGSLAPTEFFPYLGIRASLASKGNRRPAPCLAAAKQHLFDVTRELIGVAKHHQLLLSQMVPAMEMVTSARFRYGAPLVPWTDAELNKLHKTWLQVNRAAWRLPPGYPSAPIVFPSEHGGCPVAHPLVPLVQALAKHIEQLVALPDEIREITCRKYKQLCAACGCHNEQELAAHLAEEWSPRACPIARLLRACGLLKMQIKLPACLSLGIAGRDTSWRALLTHLRNKASTEDADAQLIEDVSVVGLAWNTIRRRFRRRGVQVPRQLVLNPHLPTALWLVPDSLRKNPSWLTPLQRALRAVDTSLLFPRLNRRSARLEVPVHQALLHDVIRGLQQQEGPVEPLFSDTRWQQVKSSAPARSWLSVLKRHNIPCDVDAPPHLTDPVVDLVELGQFSTATREELLSLSLWLAPTVSTRRLEDVEMLDNNPLQWVPVHLNTEKVEFDTSALEAIVRTHGQYTVTIADGLAKIEIAGQPSSTVSQGRFQLLARECTLQGVALEYLCETIPEWGKHLEKLEQKREIGSAQFWAGLQKALDSDGIVGCCPLVAPVAFSFASWDGTSVDWGHGLQPKRLVYSLLGATPQDQQRITRQLAGEQVWFVVVRRATLDHKAKQTLAKIGRVITVFKRGSRVAACKGSFRAGKLKAIQSKDDWSIWASTAALRQQPTKDSLKAAIDAICLTADGVVPLDLGHPSSREALLGPAGMAYQLSGIVVATDGSLKKNGSMGAAFVAKDNRLQARSVAVYGPPSSIRPELTGIALALEDCPQEEDLSILTDSLSAMQLLQSMQRRDFPLWLYRHTARQLLLQVVKLINARAAKGAVTRLVKVRAHRAEPLNEAADTLAAEAAELDPSLPVTMELDPEAVHFQLKGSWVEWDARVREELTQSAAALRVRHLLRAETKAMSQTAVWLLRPGQGRETIGKVLGRMQPSTAKRQILQTVAGTFPGNAVLFKWGIVPSSMCKLCGHPSETQGHIQCYCPALKEGRIHAHHNLAQRLWKGITDSTKAWTVTVEQTVAGLQGLPQPEDCIGDWQRAWDEVADAHLEGGEEGESRDEEIQRKRPDAWAINWSKRHLVILEYTRPNDRGVDALSLTDAHKVARYTPLRDRLMQYLPGWRVEIQAYSMGIRGSHDLGRWKEQLSGLGVSERRISNLIRDMVALTLGELTELYSIRYAALQNAPSP